MTTSTRKPKRALKQRTSPSKIATKPLGSDDPLSDEPIIEGKTKCVYKVAAKEYFAILFAKDDITAGDGKMHDIIPGKGRLATQTTCNVFRLLQTCGVPVAFMHKPRPNAFVAHACTMLPYEVVIRREAHGSYLKRNPHLRRGELFPRLLVEFFLKTKGRRWKNHELICDDPLMRYVVGADCIELYNPAAPAPGQKPFLVLTTKEVFSAEDEWKLFPEMEKIATRSFLVLEKAFQLLCYRLVDFKVEFGHAQDGSLLLADVIDNDSWRLIDRDERYVDKQYYRDGGSVENTKKLYELVAGLTERFTIPKQRIVLWRGSADDDLTPFHKAIGDIVASVGVTCSLHKQPVAGYNMLHSLVQECPDTVVIAYIGRSNGAGPTLAANCSVPVITVPANAKEFPEDVWSSLRTPSKTPVATVLDPSNAVAMALHILALRNPKIYAHVREDLEKRLANVIAVA